MAPRLSSTGSVSVMLAGSRFARAAFGDAAVDYYVHHARLEVQAFANAVTDWEKARYFERI